MSSCVRRLSRIVIAASALIVANAAATAGEDVPDYAFLPVATDHRTEPARPLPKFRFLFGDLARWRGPIAWRYNPANAPPPYDGDSAVAVTEIGAALDGWGAVCGIRHVYEGETTTPPNNRPRHPQYGEQPDHVNVVGWGTLEDNTAGIAYAWYDGPHGNRTIVDGDIILSVDRVRSSTAMQRTALHEWGHAIGLGHSDNAGALMSGPPDTPYNGVRTLQTDDIRGCRCIYGPAAGQEVGYSCALPATLALGRAGTGGTTIPRVVTLDNSGTGPLGVTAVTLSTLQLTTDGACAAGTVLQPGQTCTMNVTARPIAGGSVTERLTFDTSDGQYHVSVTFDGSGTAPPSSGTVQLVEFFHAGFGHYFLAHLADEIAKLDDGTFAGWSRTGRTINAWAQSAAGTSPVCRFFSSTFAPKSSHFYTSFAAECETVKANRDWTFEGEVFHVGLPDVAGSCGAGTQPVFRLYNNGMSGAPNHRFTVDTVLRQLMLDSGWVAEGAGLGATMCAPL